MGWEWVPKAIGVLFEVGLDLARKLGQEDAFIVACRESLTVGRAVVDADLDRKHGR